MASPTRLDERSSMRMYVFAGYNKAAKRVHGRPLKVFERENLMGYPVGYVETAGTYRRQECSLYDLILSKSNIKSMNCFKNCTGTHLSYSAERMQSLTRSNLGENACRKSITILLGTTIDCPMNLTNSSY